MAKSYPKYSFYTCDVDDAPLAAYDAEVTEVPSVVIQPLGLKPDGSYYDKTDMAGVDVTVDVDIYYFNHVYVYSIYI